VSVRLVGLRRGLAESLVERSLAISYQIARSITEFDPACWDALAGGEASLTHAWQRVMEASRQSYRPFYVLLRDGQGPLASAVVNASESFGKRGWRRWVVQRFPLVVRGPLSSASCGIGLRPGVDLADALPELERALSKLCWQNLRPLWGVSNVTEADLPFWRARGFLASAQWAHVVLDLPPSYEAYLAQLPASHRIAIRRLRKRAERFAVSFAHGPLAGEQEQLYALFYEVAASHDTPLEAVPFTPNFFSALEREMPDATQLFRGFVGGELAGYLFCLRYGSTLWGLVVGLHYELSRPSHLYFSLMDEMIRWSCAHGVRRIYGGMTSEQEKQKRGFGLQQRWFCYRAHPRPLQSALKVIAPFVHRSALRFPRRAPAADDDQE
jgi:predicted N-acyltransferase